MANQIGNMRTCPTRIDGAPPLFAHRVTTSRCTDRQRGSYHKCFTCAYNHAYVKAHGLPVVDPDREGAPEPVEQPLAQLIQLEREVPHSRPQAPAPRAGEAGSARIGVV